MLVSEPKSAVETFSYEPIYKPKQLSLGTGRIVVVTGWTPKQAIAKSLKESDYAAIGSLYSATRGINFLVRNLLNNPHISALVLVQATREDQNAGSVQCLLDFFYHGVSSGFSDIGRECWVINSPIKGYIDIEIPLDQLECMRLYFAEGGVPGKNKRLFNCITFSSAITATTFLARSLENNAPEANWAQDQFPFPEVSTTIFPGNRYGHRIEGETIAETWVKIIHRIRKTGTLRPTGYDGQWQELIDLVAVVTNEPDGFYFPEPNYLPCDRESVESYLPQMTKDAPYAAGTKYSYGQRMRSWFGCDQIEAIIQKLVAEEDSASAVISLWDAGGINHGDLHPEANRDNGDSDHDHGGSPCLNHIWVRIVDDEMSLTATFRSNDMYSAWCTNAMGLRALQKLILVRVSEGLGKPLRMGPLITISQSSHLYDDCFESSDRIIESQYQRIIHQELNRYNDSVGNFIITIDKTIKISQTTPNSGEIVREYEGRNPLVLMREICRDNPAIAPSHIGYLGIELQKAAQSLVTGNTIYIQDR